MPDQTWLADTEALELISRFGVPVPDFGLARSAEEAVQLAAPWDEPFVLKVVGPNLQHKSDVGGVRMGVRRHQIGDVYEELIEAVRRSTDALPIDGVLVQTQVPPGIEVIVGARKDPAFGHILLFGAGGILSELVDDVALRLLPLNRETARTMITSTRVHGLLRGIRGLSAGDIDAACSVLVAVSDMVTRHPEIVELDLNPVIIYPRGAMAVDALVAVRPTQCAAAVKEESDQ